MFYYLTGHRTSALDKSVGTAREAFRVGLLVQPFTKDYLRHDVARHYDCCGVDNGCFTKTGQARFSLPEYERIAKLAHYEFGENLYFVTAEDVPFDWEGTLRKSLGQLPVIRRWGVPAALVLQNGATVDNVPWGEFDALFIGGSAGENGSPKWKTGPECQEICNEARKRGILVHMGRVNTPDRIKSAHDMGLQSADGTFLKHESEKRQTHMLLVSLEQNPRIPEANNPEVIEMLKKGMTRMNPTQRIDWRRDFYRLTRGGSVQFQTLVQQTTEDGMSGAISHMADWFRDIRQGERKKAMDGIPPHQVRDYELAGQIPLRDPDFDAEDGEYVYKEPRNPYWQSPRYKN